MKQRFIVSLSKIHLLRLELKEILSSYIERVLHYFAFLKLFYYLLYLVSSGGATVLQMPTGIIQVLLERIMNWKVKTKMQRSRSGEAAFVFGIDKNFVSRSTYVTLKTHRSELL